MPMPLITGQVKHAERPVADPREAAGPASTHSTATASTNTRPNRRPRALALVTG